MPLLTSYVDNSSLETAISLGFDKLLIEDQQFSILANNKSENITHKIKNLYNKAKKLNPQIKLVFNIDIITHQNNVNIISNLINSLYTIGYDGIRVQDIGLAWLIYNKYPKINLEINTQTANRNYKAINFMENNFKPSLKTIVLSNEIPKDQLKTIIDKSSTQTEILIHGPILMFQSKRRLIEQSNFINKAIKNQNNYEIYLKEQKRENDWFLFKDNPHGSFMFFSRELCLINQIDEILKLKIPSLLFDFRNKSSEVMINVTRAYKDKINNPTIPNNQNLLNKINKYYPQGLTEGFFNNNPTDNININMNQPNPIAKVIGLVKYKLIAVEVYSKFNNENTLKINTPEGKTFVLNNYTIKNIEGDQITQTTIGDVVLLNWHKGITPESLLYINK